MDELRTPVVAACICHLLQFEFSRTGGSVATGMKTRGGGDGPPREPFGNGSTHQMGPVVAELAEHAGDKPARADLLPV